MRGKFFVPMLTVWPALLERGGAAAAPEHDGNSEGDREGRLAAGDCASDHDPPQ